MTKKIVSRFQRFVKRMLGKKLTKAENRFLVIMRRIYALIWTFSNGFVFLFYVGRTKLGLDTGDPNRLMNHRSHLNAWVNGKHTDKCCYYDWLNSMLKSKNETHWRAQWRDQHNTLPEVRIKLLEKKVMNDFEAERLETHYQEIHENSIFNIQKGDGEGNPREVSDQLIFGGICYINHHDHRHNPWVVKYATGNKKRSRKGNIYHEQYYKQFATIREAYDHLKEQFNIRVLEPRFKNCVLRPFEYYSTKYQ